jgi:hypothetical protein
MQGKRFAIKDFYYRIGTEVEVVSETHVPGTRFRVLRS